MNIKEAVSKVLDHALGAYILSDDVYRFTMEFHKGDEELFWRVCKGVATEGTIIVDNCSEDAYQIFGSSEICEKVYWGLAQPTRPGRIAI